MLRKGFHVIRRQCSSSPFIDYQGFDCAYERHCDLRLGNKHILVRKFKIDVNCDHKRNPKWMLDMMETM
jgi:hypothetical protein